MRIAFEGSGFSSTKDVEVVIEDDRGNDLCISAHEALELMELLQNNIGWLEEIRNEEKKKGKR